MQEPRFEDVVCNMMAILPPRCFEIGAQTMETMVPLSIAVLHL